MDQGAVLGIDVGASTVKRSSAICRLFWDRSTIGWAIERCRALEPERSATIRRVAAGAPIAAAAFDGPLRAGLDEIGRYRCAERMLTRGLGRRIGKPGQSSAPVGRLLNRHANLCAVSVIEQCELGAARHRQAIHPLAIVEAFPSAFLGVLLDQPELLTARRSNRSDVYFQHLATNGALAAILASLLPGRALASPLSAITDHDERAAWVCALTALGVALGSYCAVGDADGWIILPGQAHVRPWAMALLATNMAAEQGPALSFAAPLD